MKLITVNYHNLKYPQKRLLTDRGVELGLFKRQLQSLGEYFTPIKFSDYRNAENTLDPDGNYAIVTFDDGMKDCVEAALPAAAELNFPISFFICTLPLIEHRLLAVQKNHLLLEKISIMEFARLFYERLKDSQNIYESKLPPGLDPVTAYRYDTPEIKTFKMDLNYLLPYSVTMPIIDQIFSQYFPNESELVNELYLDEFDIRRIQDAGHEIGGHSHAHLMFSKLSFAEQEKDILDNKQALSAFTDTELPFSVPFGHIGTFSQDLRVLLSKHGFFNLISMERGFNIDKCDQYNLKRYDVNDIFTPEGNLTQQILQYVQ